ncbi:exopolysaccharide transport family protein [Singulisphaera acidiphila]|uniref:Capsular exopolysaccharide biosynthesis protein n=1 Tax=Singulisphaera acidiphila (strain ATCC BAA-1392 / DSM 18658 / VKM B-2454 / MOB10) TaxID=886293 RepID=L0DK20_SINAD|nr:tyrosine-protein kinase domain-containing protein [Singulisphaera acidiphila]AGA29602.1 capsular exopolysaccharide biosynthesis protein [Singulisphaera acidiphila DSM 18658]
MMSNSNFGPQPNSANLPAVVPPHRAEVFSVSSPPAGPVAGLDPVAMLKALRRRWPLALGAGLLGGAVLAFATYFLVPPAKYTARSMLHVSSTQPRILLKVGENETDFVAYQRTQLALLKSRLVLGTALKDPEVAKLEVITKAVDPIEWLEKELQVDFASGSEILRISINGEKPHEPMLLVNAVTQAYIDEIVDVETKQRRQRYDLLKETWNRYQENLKEKRKELKRLTELAGSDDKKTIANIHQHELDRLGRAEDELARVQSELRGLRVEHEVLQEDVARNSSMITPAMIVDAINRDHSIEVLKEREAAAQKAIDRIYHIARNKSDPSLKKHRDELEAARTAMVAQRRKLYPIVEQQLQEIGRDDDDSNKALIPHRISILSKLEAVLASDVKRLSERSLSITQNSVDLFSVQEEIANADEIARTIGKEVEALTVELQAPARIRLLEKAELPRTKDEARQLKMAGVAGCGAFALALIGVSFWEFQSRRIDSAADVIKSLGMNLFGTLPAIPKRSRGMKLREAESVRWRSMLVESVDAARTTLLHFSRTESVRVVMVASALSGEGKTSLSSHLATSLARAGRRTLLIDGDLRRPSAHELFDQPCVPGFSEVLRNEVNIADAIQPTAASGLSLLTAGLSDNETIQALACRDLRVMFDQLKEHYDFIVVDSSPVLPVADALLIGQHVDAVLFSIMRDVSRIPKVHEAYERLAKLGIRMLGAIVTGEQSDHYGSKYGYSARAQESV